MEIRELHRDDLSPGELTALTALTNQVDLELLAGDPPIPEQIVYDRLNAGGRFYERRHWALFDGQVAIAAAESETTSGYDNLDLAWVGIGVARGHKRGGSGTALFEHVRTELRAQGRTKLWGWGRLDDETRSFWQDHNGFDFGYDERVSRCMLADVDAALMAAWIERGRERASGYHLERWVGACPDHLVAPLVAAKNAMNDAPMDDLEMEDEVWDVTRVRDMETQGITQGLEVRSILAVETATGAPGGYSAVALPHARPQRSYQYDTVTLASHRQRGLGKLMKAEMWQWLRTERSDVESLDTENAESNHAMLSINVAMGFRPILHIGVWQKAEAAARLE